MRQAEIDIQREREREICFFCFFFADTELTISMHAYALHVCVCRLREPPKMRRELRRGWQLSHPDHGDEMMIMIIHSTIINNIGTRGISTTLILCFLLLGSISVAYLEHHSAHTWIHWEICTPALA